MGTSTHNGGQKGGTPLVPSWLDQPDANVQNETTPDVDGGRFHQWVMQINLGRHGEHSRGT